MSCNLRIVPKMNAYLCSPGLSNNVGAKNVCGSYIAFYVAVLYPEINHCIAKEEMDNFPLLIESFKIGSPSEIAIAYSEIQLRFNQFPGYLLNNQILLLFKLPRPGCELGIFRFGLFTLSTSLPYTPQQLRSVFDLLF